MFLDTIEFVHNADRCFQIRAMKALKILCLEKNLISVIPKEILSCIEVTELHLGNNR